MTSSTLYPPIATEEGELDLALDDDIDDNDDVDMEDGEIDPVDEPFVAAKETSSALQHGHSGAVEDHREPDIVRPTKKRKVRHSNSKTSHSKSHATNGGGSSGFMGNSDFWDDSELIDAWDRAMDRQKRKDRGDPVSDSDNELDNPHQESESQHLSAEEQVNADAYVEALWQQQQQSMHSALPAAAATAAPAPTTIPDVDLAQLADAEILHRATQYSYMAGYYAGYLAGRREKSS